MASAGSNAMGVAVNVNAPNLNATGGLFAVGTYSAALGIETDANSTHGTVYGAKLGSTAGGDSAQNAYGIYSLTEHGGSGIICGVTGHEKRIRRRGETGQPG